MFKAALGVATVIVGLAAAGGVANAQNYGNYNSAPSRNYELDRRVNPPRPHILTSGEIAQHLRQAGWFGVRDIQRHVWYYTARAYNWRGSYTLVINGYTGRVTSATRINYRRY